MARATDNRWTNELPTVLLGLRTALREDSNISPALMTYGSTLRVPSDFFAPTKPNIEDAEFVRQLTETMSSLSPKSTRQASRSNTFIYKDLGTCTHVFVRNDNVRRPLVPPYDGPYQVLQRSTDGKHFTLQLPLRTAVISIDRLKPAHLLNEEDSPENTTSTNTPAPDTSPTPMRTASSSSPQNTYITRSGRAVKKKRTLRLGGSDVAYVYKLATLRICTPEDKLATHVYAALKLGEIFRGIVQKVGRGISENCANVFRGIVQK